MSGLASWESVRALLPLVIPPTYIAVVSVAERRWGQSWSGRLTAIPTQTTTVILLVALADGPSSAAVVSAGAILGVISLSAFAVGYGLTSSRAAWTAAIFVAVVSFLAVGFGLVEFHGTPVEDSLAALGTIAVGLAVLTRIDARSEHGQHRALGLPVRMGLATFLVLSVALSVPYLGPVAAGTLGVFPIVTAPMTVLNHRESGPDASRRYLIGLEWGLIGGVVFFLTLSLLLGEHGIPVAFAVAIPVLVATLLGAFLLPDRFRGTP